MRAVQLEQVETGPPGPLRRLGELPGDLGHAGPRQLARYLVGRRVGDRGRAAHLPVAFGQGLVDALPHQPGGALTA